MAALDELANIKGELVEVYKQIEAEEERKRKLEEAKRREVSLFVDYIKSFSYILILKQI